MVDRFAFELSDTVQKKEIPTGVKPMPLPMRDKGLNSQLDGKTLTQQNRRLRIWLSQRQYYSIWRGGFCTQLAATTVTNLLTRYHRETESDLEQHHKFQDRDRHPNEKAATFSMLFLSMNGLSSISLRPGNCMCNACHRDCLRGEGKPRWCKLAKCLVNRHCMMCCSASLSCSVTV